MSKPTDFSIQTSISEVSHGKKRKNHKSRKGSKRNHDKVRELRKAKTPRIRTIKLKKASSNKTTSLTPRLPSNSPSFLASSSLSFNNKYEDKHIKKRRRTQSQNKNGPKKVQQSGHHKKAKKKRPDLNKQASNHSYSSSSSSDDDQDDVDDDEDEEEFSRIISLSFNALYDDEQHSNGKDLKQMKHINHIKRSKPKPIAKRPKNRNRVSHSMKLKQSVSNKYPNRYNNSRKSQTPNATSSASLYKWTDLRNVDKEDRDLSTWSKMEIAEWLQLNWYTTNSPQNKSKLNQYVNKIKREKRFNGGNIHKLNDRDLRILAQRYLGLKKGDNDYRIFMNRIHELQHKYSSKHPSKSFIKKVEKQHKKKLTKKHARNRSFSFHEIYDIAEEPNDRKSNKTVHHHHHHQHNPKPFKLTIHDEKSNAINNTKRQNSYRLPSKPKTYRKRKRKKLVRKGSDILPQTKTSLKMRSFSQQTGKNKKKHKQKLPKLAIKSTSNIQRSTTPTSKAMRAKKKQRKTSNLSKITQNKHHKTNKRPTSANFRRSNSHRNKNSNILSPSIRDRRNAMDHIGRNHGKRRKLRKSKSKNHKNISSNHGNTVLSTLSSLTYNKSSSKPNTEDVVVDESGFVILGENDDRDHLNSKLLQFSITSPAGSPSPPLRSSSPAVKHIIDLKKRGNYDGVTADELLQLISYGHADEIDSEYDTDTNWIDTNYKDDEDEEDDDVEGATIYDMHRLQLAASNSANNSNLSNISTSLTSMSSAYSLNGTDSELHLNSSNSSNNNDLRKKPKKKLSSKKRSKSRNNLKQHKKKNNTQPDPYYYKPPKHFSFTDASDGTDVSDPDNDENINHINKTTKINDYLPPKTSIVTDLSLSYGTNTSFSQDDNNKTTNIMKKFPSFEAAMTSDLIMDDKETKHTTMVIPSIFAIDDTDDNGDDKLCAPKIALSPIISSDTLKSENRGLLMMHMMCYSMTDESSDEGDENSTVKQTLQTSKRIIQYALHNSPEHSPNPEKHSQTQTQQNCSSPLPTTPTTLQLTTSDTGLAGLDGSADFVNDDGID